ncbi:MAG: DMT family transporter [Acidobacteria bacterium]|nr:DMT family transporter [Acidobacteriota bacterium]
MKPRHWTVFFLLSLIWGASFFWIKIAVQETGPLTVVTLRITFAVMILLIFLIAQKHKPPSRKMWVPFFIQGLFSAALPWILITWAEKSIDSAQATVLNATVPLFTLIIAHFYVADDRISPSRILGLLLGFMGVVVLVHKDLGVLLGPESGGLDLPFFGKVAMILASLCYGISNVYAKVKFRNVPPVQQAFFTLLLVDAVMWMTAPVIESPFTLPAKPITWIAILWLGFLGAGISYLMFYGLLQAIGPTRVSLITYVIPVVGVTLGVIFLNETLDWSLAVAALLIVVGVWAVNRK